MLRVQLICIGRLKESFYAAACEEYSKRLQRCCALDILELPETGDIKRDGAAMLARIGSGAFVVAMCIEGKGYSSEELAAPSGAGHGSGADLPRLQYQRGREIS